MRTKMLSWPTASFFTSTIPTHTLNTWPFSCVRGSFRKKERSSNMSSLLLHAASKHRKFNCPLLAGQVFKRNCSLRVITNTNRTFSGLETSLWVKSPACAPSPNCGDSGSKAFVLGGFRLRWNESAFCIFAPPHGIPTNQNKRWCIQKK